MVPKIPKANLAQIVQNFLKSMEVYSLLVSMKWTLFPGEVSQINLEMPRL